MGSAAEREETEWLWWEVFDCDVLAPMDEIRQIYRRLVQQHHPDKGGDDEKFKQVQAAWMEAQER